MPWNISRSAQFLEREILKLSDGSELAKSVVLDATDVASWPMDTTIPPGRTVVPAGTILKLSATNTTQYVKYQGTGRIEGILAHSVELLANATAGDEPAPMYWHTAVFATPAIVGFTQYASALVSTLTTCKFE
jgi:hypothetical protein